MCGNGTRCTAKYVYDKGLTDKTTFTLEIRCDTLVACLDDLDKAVADLVPADGTLYAQTTLSFTEGESGVRGKVRFDLYPFQKSVLYNFIGQWGSASFGSSVSIPPIFSTLLSSAPTPSGTSS